MLPRFGMVSFNGFRTKTSVTTFYRYLDSLSLRPRVVERTFSGATGKSGPYYGKYFRK